MKLIDAVKTANLITNTVSNGGYIKNNGTDYSEEVGNSVLKGTYDDHIKKIYEGLDIKKFMSKAM